MTSICAISAYHPDARGLSESNQNLAVSAQTLSDTEYRYYYGIMKSFRKYPIENMGHIPINLGVTRGVFPGTGILHNHSAVEVNLLLEGQADYLISGNAYQCVEGDIILIGEEEVHRAWNADDAVFLVLQFKREVLLGEASSGYDQKVMTPFWGLGKQFSHVVRSTSRFYTELRELLLAMELEIRERQNSYRLMVKAQIMVFATLLGRALDIQDDSPLLEKGMKIRRFAPVVEFIESHYGDRILVADLADLVNMSPANFTRLFRSAFGQSPIEYLMQQRIRHASILLKKNNWKIIDISTDCGFPSVSHFIDIFRKYTGQTPSDYRKDQLQ